jgi:tight adherence protein E
MLIKSSFDLRRIYFYFIKIHYAAKRLYSERRGAIAVEFAIIGPVFLILFFVIMNLCWVFYMTAAIDLAVVEAGKTASVSNKEYQKIFKQKLEHQDSLWRFLINSEKATFNITYCQSISDVLSDNCIMNPSQPESYPIAIYEVRYNYLSEVFADYFTLNFRVQDIYIQGDKSNGL